MKTPALLLLTLLATACASTSGSRNAGEPAPVQPGDGSFEGRTYSNPFFGLRITTPEGWSVATAAETGVLQDTGEEILAGDDDARKARLRAALKRTTSLLTVSRHPIGAVGQANAALQLMAEYIPLTAVGDGGAYLEVVRETLKRGPAAALYQPQGDIGSRSIDGREFASLLYHIELNGAVISQLYLARKFDAHVLGCVLTWQTDSDQQELEKLLATLRFR